MPLCLCASAHLTAYVESEKACSGCPVLRVFSDAFLSASRRASFLRSCQLTFTFTSRAPHLPRSIVKAKSKHE